MLQMISSQVIEPTQSALNCVKPFTTHCLVVKFTVDILDHGKPCQTIDQSLLQASKAKCQRRT